MTKRRLEVGFGGGNVLRVTMDQAAADALVGAISTGGDTWTAFEAEEGSFWVNPRELCFVRIAPEDAAKVGFGK